MLPLFSNYQSFLTLHQNQSIHTWTKKEKTEKNTPSHFRSEYFNRSNDNGVKRASEDSATAGRSSAEFVKRHVFQFQRHSSALLLLLLINGPEEERIPPQRCYTGFTPALHVEIISKKGEMAHSACPFGVLPWWVRYPTTGLGFFARCVLDRVT